MSKNDFPVETPQLKVKIRSAEISSTPYKLADGTEGVSYKQAAIITVADFSLPYVIKHAEGDQALAAGDYQIDPISLLAETAANQPDFFKRALSHKSVKCLILPAGTSF